MGDSDARAPHGDDAICPGFWRDGKYLVVHRLAVFPNVCVKSNLPAQGRRVSQKLSWHPPLWYAIRLLHPAADATVHALVNRTATIEVGLSEVWSRKRLRGRIAGGVVIAAGLAAMAAAVAWMNRAVDQAMFLFIAGMFVTFAGLIYAMSANVLVSAKRMWQEYIWLGGVHRDLVARCPDWPGENWHERG